MKTTIHHGTTSVHRSKGVGSHVTVHISGEKAGEWDGIYRFSSHGMTVEGFHARVSELKAYHHDKMKRLSGFNDLQMRDIFVAGAKFRILDANLTERGTDVELQLGVYRIGTLGHQSVEFRLDHGLLIYPSIDAVPDDDAIVAIVRFHLEAQEYRRNEHAAFVKAVS